MSVGHIFPLHSPYHSAISANEHLAQCHFKRCECSTVEMDANANANTNEVHVMSTCAIPYAGPNNSNREIEIYRIEKKKIIKLNK